MTLHEEVQFEGVRYLVFAVKTLGGYRGEWICHDSGDRGEYAFDVSSPESAVRLANRDIEARHTAMQHHEESTMQASRTPHASSQGHHDRPSAGPLDPQFIPVDLLQKNSREQRHRHALVMQAVSRWAQADLQLIAAVDREVLQAPGTS